MTAAALLVDAVFAKAYIKGYTKADGTVVKPHEDKRIKAALKPAAKWSAGGAPSQNHGQPGLFGGNSGNSGSSGNGGSSGKKPTPKAFHPKVGDKGEKVGIYAPNVPDVTGFADSGAVVTVTPGCSGMPEALNGIPFQPWTPPAADRWDYVAGQKDDLEEPAMVCPKGKAPASGLIIVEPDGRAWVISPTNKFGGYKNTFPKGKAEEGLSYQANAIKEAWEEAGIKADVIGFVGDVERSTSVTRYYLARRVAGNPAKDMGWESQAAHLVPISQLKGFLDASVDHKVVDLLAG